MYKYTQIHKAVTTPSKTETPRRTDDRWL